MLALMHAYVNRTRDGMLSANVILYASLSVPYGRAEKLSFAKRSLCCP
jgi:hypothetical protein